MSNVLLERRVVLEVVGMSTRVGVSHLIELAFTSLRLQHSLLHSQPTDQSSSLLSTPSSSASPALTPHFTGH